MSPAAQPVFDARTLLDRRSLQKILGGKMLHEKVTTVYLKPHVRAQAEDEAAASNRKLSPYLSWLIDQMLNWRFLTNANLEFIKALSMETRRAVGHDAGSEPHHRVRARGNVRRKTSPERLFLSTH